MPLSSVFNLIVLLIGLIPLLLGVYAWRLMRNRDQDNRDDPPPPPPEPPAPLPSGPSAFCRTDRPPLHQRPVRLPSFSPRRVLR